MEVNLVAQGMDLMLYGMGTVFVFLTVLVGSTTLMSAIVTRFFPDMPEISNAPTSKAAQMSQPVDARTLSVIQAAIHQHRASKH